MLRFDDWLVPRLPVALLSLSFCRCFSFFIVGGWSVFHNNGIGASVWCIVLGAVLRNILPAFEEYYKKTQAYSVEFFIQISLVLLAVDMNQVAQTGPRDLLLRLEAPSVHRGAPAAAWQCLRQTPPACALWLAAFFG